MRIKLLTILCKTTAFGNSSQVYSNRLTNFSTELYAIKKFGIKIYFFSSFTFFITYMVMVYSVYFFRISLLFNYLKNMHVFHKNQKN